jgi:selenocysteine lyase/cysteine desulfurase
MIAYETSRSSDAVLDETCTALADFLNASRPKEIVFGDNMTSLTFATS